MNQLGFWNSIILWIIIIIFLGIYLSKNREKISFWQFLIYFGAVAIATPLLLGAFMSQHLVKGINVGSKDGWLGFFGGYLGAIVSIGGVYWSVNEQFKHEKQQQMEAEQRAKIVESYYKIASLIRGVSAGLNTNYILFNLKDGFLNKYYRDKLREEIEATTSYFVKFRDDYNSENYIFDYESDDKKWLDIVNNIDEEFATQILSELFPDVLGRLNDFENSLSSNKNVKREDLSESQKFSLSLLSDAYQLSVKKVTSFQDRYTNVIDEIKNRIDEVYKQK